MSEQEKKSRLERMAAALAHRGPDDRGIYSDPDAALAHTRLSIIDLSSAGHQPMSNEDGTLWLSYNGEIYNHLSLRSELEGNGHVFKSHTDSEVIIHAYEEWGTECLQHFNGMFAFALWDSRKKTLFCARDRLGIKPFYYASCGKLFVFASEIKAILQGGFVDKRPDYKSLFLFLTYAQTDYDSSTFFKDIRCLEPAHYLLVSKDTMKHFCYWKLSQSIAPDVNADASEEEFLELLKDSIALRLQSDVPVGTCLSGGLDSSSIVSLASSHLKTRVKTFSACYPEEPQFNERKYIDSVIAETRADAYFVYPGPRQFISTFREMMVYLEEPTRDFTQFTQWHVMKRVAQEEVKVILDGQGGDELLAGYHALVDYYWLGLLITGKLPRLMQEIRVWRDKHGPGGSKRLARLAYHLLPYHYKNLLYARYNGMLPLLNADFRMAQKGQSFPARIPCTPATPLTKALFLSLTQTSLPRLLHYEDTISMAFSIEARVPFLDHRLVEFVGRLPDEKKVYQGETKWILRSALRDILPSAVLSRQDKLGYPTPLHAWVCKDHSLFHAMADVLLSSPSDMRGLFDRKRVAGLIRTPPQNLRTFAKLWRIFSTELWFQTFF